MSRADLSRETGLTRVTISDLVAELISDGFVAEMGVREASGPESPRCWSTSTVTATASSASTSPAATSSSARCSPSTATSSCAARSPLPTGGGRGRDGGRPRPRAGRRRARPRARHRRRHPRRRRRPRRHPHRAELRLGGFDLEGALHDALGLPVLVANDANAAVLAEYTFGGAGDDVLLVKVGRGVGSGLLASGQPMRGGRFAAGEIGHVTVGTDGGPSACCGKVGCLEAWLAVPALTAATRRGIRRHPRATASCATRGSGSASRSRPSSARSTCRRSCSPVPPNFSTDLSRSRPSRLSAPERSPQFHDGVTRADDGARPGHRPARRRRHGPLRTTRGVLDTLLRVTRTQYPPGWVTRSTRTPRNTKEDTMNKKLGALALVGASAVVLAGCAGGTGGTAGDDAASGDLTVWLVGTDTPDDGARLPQEDLRGRERGLDPHGRGEDLGRHERDLRRRAVLQRLSRRRRGRQHPGARLHRPGPVRRHHRHQGGPRRRRPAPGPRRRRHLRRRRSTRRRTTPVAASSSTRRRSSPASCRRRSTSTSPTASR